MTRPRWLTVPLVLLVTGCSLLPEGRGDERVLTFPPDERRPAPAIVAENLDGERLALADLDGPVVVNFWASWCGPCRSEAPHLNAIARTYEDERLTVVGVNTRDDLANAHAFAATQQLAFDSWFDPDQEIAAQFAGAGPPALPTTIVLDNQHRVAARYFGAVNGAMLAPTLDAITAEDGIG